MVSSIPMQTLAYQESPLVSRSNEVRITVTGDSKSACGTMRNYIHGESDYE